MLIHLFADDISEELFEEVLSSLNSVDGPLEFVKAQKYLRVNDICYSYSAEPLGEEDFEKELPVGMAWDDLLESIRSTKRDCGLKREDHFFFLTNDRNEYNWFSFGDEWNNHYVHCDSWEYFTDSDFRFPVTFLVASGLLQSCVYGNMEKLMEAVHHETRGCLMDLCINKKDIQMKMRTADCCGDCMKDIQNAINEGRFQAAHYMQLMEIMESIREQLLFKSRYSIQQKPSELRIGAYTRKLRLSQFGNLELKLNPLEKTLYLFFLNHPEGVHLNDLGDPENKREIKSSYENLSVLLDEERITQSIEQLTNPLENSASEKISRINRKIKRAVGDELAIPYLISGPRGEAKGIALDRQYVIYEDQG